MQDWRFINSFANWFSALGTIGAVIVALYLARQDKRIRLRVSAGYRNIISPGTECDPRKYLAIRITNIGHRDVQIVGIGWRIGLFRKFYADQLIISDGLSSTLPIKLRDGDEASYFFPLFGNNEWLKEEFIKKMLKPQFKLATSVHLYTCIYLSWESLRGTT